MAGPFQRVFFGDTIKSEHINALQSALENLSADDITDLDPQDLEISTDANNISITDAPSNFNASNVETALAELKGDINNITIDKSDLGLENVPNVDSQDASNLNSGQVPDAQISESSVTQHESSITISEDQVSDRFEPFSQIDGIQGVLSTGKIFTSLAPNYLIISKGEATVDTPPIGGPVTIDIIRNGVSAATVSIADGALTSTSSGFPISYAPGDDFDISLSTVNGAEDLRYMIFGGEFSEGSGVVTQLNTPIYTSVSTINPDTISVNWNSVGGADNYELQHRVDGNSWQSVYNGALTSKTFTISDNTGFHEVRVNASGSNNFTSDWNQIVIPQMPQGISSNSTGVDSFEILWNQLNWEGSGADPFLDYLISGTGVDSNSNNLGGISDNTVNGDRTTTIFEFLNTDHSAIEAESTWTMQVQARFDYSSRPNLTEVSGFKSSSTIVSTDPSSGAPNMLDLTFKSNSVNKVTILH